MENLVTEFNGKLACALDHGQYFDIDVVTTDQPRSFHISLTNKKLNDDPNADVGLRFVVHFNEHQIVAESRNGLLWKTEMTSACDKNGFSKGPIKIILCLNDNSFHISLNGVHKMRTFYHDSLDKLQAIQIGGDVKLITRVDHPKIYPSVWPASACQTGLAMSNDIPVHFQPGHLIVMTGRCYGSPVGQLGINIRSAYNTTQMLHFNPRFGSGIVVRNSLIPRTDGSLGYIYGIEESSGGFPFDFHKSFRMGIGCRASEFIVAINGSYFCTFAYRDPLKHDLDKMVGVQVVGAHGTGVKITEIDHIQLHDPACSNMESFTRLPGVE